MRILGIGNLLNTRVCSVLEDMVLFLLQQVGPTHIIYLQVVISSKREFMDSLGSKIFFKLYIIL